MSVHIYIYIHFALNIFEESLVLVGVEAWVDHYKWTACGNIAAVSKHDHILYLKLFLSYFNLHSDLARSNSEDSSSFCW